MQERKAEISRVTGETNVHISLDLDGTGKAQIPVWICAFPVPSRSRDRKGTDPYRDWFFRPYA